MTTKILVNNGSDKGLLSDDTKPLPETMLTQYHWHPFQHNFIEKCARCAGENYHSKLIFQDFPASNRGQWVKLISCHDIIMAPFHIQPWFPPLTLTYNRANTQFPWCTCPITHNAPFRTKCIHLYSEWCIVVYVRLVYRTQLHITNSQTSCPSRTQS